MSDLPKRHRPGSQWRTLAWKPDPAVGKGDRIQIEDSSDEHDSSTFDEVVIDQWFHLEQMDHRNWWMAVYREDGSQVTVNVRVGERGRASHVSVHEEPADDE